MRNGIVALVLLLTAPTLRAQGAPLPSRPDLSWSDADSLGRKLDDLDSRRRTGDLPHGQTVLVTEGELNSYVNLSLGPKMPRGLSDVAVRLEHERLHVTGVLDLERVRDKMPRLSPLSPLYWLGGQVGVLLRGRLLNDDGFGTIEWEDVRVGSVPVPLTLLQQIVTSLTKTSENPAGFDIRAPFRLPYSLRRVRLEPGRALLDF
jgi:hypothetical protein